MRPQHQTTPSELEPSEPTPSEPAPSAPAARSTGRATPAVVIGAAVLDAVLITLFAWLGRSSHARSLDVAGTFETAWPFLVGALAAWLVARVWRFPTSLRHGLIVWISTLAIGMLVRWVTVGAPQLPFILVAGGVLFIFVFGWRLVPAAFRMLNRPPRG